MFTRRFWLAAIERAMRTGAAAGLGVIGAQAAITELHAAAIVATIGAAVVIDLLTSIAGTSPMAPGPPGSGPSLTPVETVRDHAPHGDD